MRNFWIIVVLFLLGCDSDRVFEENIPINENTWKAYQEISFQFTIPDSTATYDIYCNLRNTPKYPNHNIYIRYILKDSIGTKLEGELKNFILFDPKSGAPYGKSGLGDLFDHQNLLLEEYKFPFAGTYSIALEQLMRYENLPEVNSTGIRVEYHR
jgi:gliding motility-associated lipoprotein GldH